MPGTGSVFPSHLRLISPKYSPYGANAVWLAACSFSLITGSGAGLMTTVK